MSLKTLKEKALKNPSVVREYHKLSREFAHIERKITRKNARTHTLSS
jgi:hypothetical protein